MEHDGGDRNVAGTRGVGMEGGKGWSRAGGWHGVEMRGNRPGGGV